MRLSQSDKHFDHPGLFVVKARELPLSGRALLDLMRSVLSRGHSFRFRARGWSMAPFIRDGDVITVAPQSKALPGVGEVVAFTRPQEGKLVVHRVLSRRGSAFLIQGDNGLEYADGFIALENLLGRVTQIERRGRPVRLGLGPERYLVAWLSRLRLLVPLQVRLASWLKRLS